MPAENIQISADWIRTIEHINNGLIKEDSPLFRIVEPIPLTAEILEKNGFEKQNDGWYKITLEEENLIGVQPFENVNWIFGANVFPNIIEHLNILYVHELQHALRLCGVEKEITI